MRLSASFCITCSFLITSAIGVARSESITVRLVNGENNKVVTRARVYVVLGDPKIGSSLDLMTDKLGELHFETPDVKSFELRTVGFFSCEEAYSGIHNPAYSVAKVRETGVVTRNGCGKYTAETARDVLVLYVKPASTLDMFRN